MGDISKTVTYNKRGNSYANYRINGRVVVVIAFLLSSCSSTSPATTAVPVFGTSVAALFTSTKTIIATPVSTQTAVLCPKTFRVGDMTVYFDNVGPADCTQFTQYIPQMNDWINQAGYSTGPAEIRIFGTIEDLIPFDRKWTSYWGFGTPSDRDLQQRWQRSGDHALPCLVLMTTDPDSWWGAETSGNQVKNTLHAMMHLVQYYSYSQCSRVLPQIPNGSVPYWWIEGEADYYGFFLAHSWGNTPNSLQAGQCTNFSLSDLEEFSQDKHICSDILGAEAMWLLEKQYGQKDLKIWQPLHDGKSFAQAFEIIYGITIDEFSTAFQEHMTSAYGPMRKPDSSFCSDFVSSGDIHISCVGRIFVVDYDSWEYHFNVSGYDLSGIQHGPGIVTSNCLIDWGVSPNTSILSLSLDNTKSPITCTVTFKPSNNEKMAEFTFVHLP